jgi:four helix bundle protein
MALQVATFSFEMIGALRPLMPQIRRRDRALADQISRAASSVALNIAEGDFSDPGNARARFFTAAGSANETLAGLKVAVGWGYLEAHEAAAGTALLQRLVPMLWKLARR